MRLATLRSGNCDGDLVVVSSDACLAVRATGVADTLLEALRDWGYCEKELADIYLALNSRRIAGAFPFDPRMACAPLRRAPQWCDGSAFLSHARRLAVAFDTPINADLSFVPMMHQGRSDELLGPHDDIRLPDAGHGIDFEGEFAVIVDNVPMGCPASDALEHVCLVVQLNDISLRMLSPHERRVGLGYLNAKPVSSFAPIAVTPDELGSAWDEGKVKLPLYVEMNGKWFGSPSGREMCFGFDRLIEHAARTRNLTAGTIIGSGTVSNDDEGVGTACISERRAVEVIVFGNARTPFMQYGDRVRMEARAEDGSTPFGEINQRVVSYTYARQQPA
jgi:fumarylacetoacetate (FAA) hydrolase